MSYLINILNFLLLIIIFSVITLISVFWYFGRDLPSFSQLSNYEPAIISRIFASDGEFVEEYSRENRVFSSFDHIPEQLINCFLVAEDRNFYDHIGFDMKGIIRAAGKNALNILKDKRPQGASTITQQVAKNFLLSGEISYSRKIKEIILSLRIEKTLSKKQIMELYLNEIYLGNRSYGVASASKNYFNKSLNELSLDEMALLAALPKAPSTYNPFTNPQKAIERRNWVLTRLYSEGFIDTKKYEKSLKVDLKLDKKIKMFSKKATFFKEAIRREIINKYDEEKLYNQGLSIMSTLDTKLQLLAEKSFQKGIKEFDYRKGWRGSLDRIKSIKEWHAKLKKIKKPEGLYSRKLGVVLKVSIDSIKVGLEDNSVIFLYKEHLKIIRNVKDLKLSNVFKLGDVLVLEKKVNTANSFFLSQIPDVNGGLIAIENNSGRILAMVGGYDSSSSFNRVTQALRQPGSAFKPFVYIAALENRFTPVSKVLDAPVIIDGDSNLKKWRPTNYGNKFYGLSTLRLGIEKSRNLMTVRLAKEVGLEKIRDLSVKAGIYNNLPNLMSLSLGSVETNLIKIASAYSMIANGGFLVKPSLIDKIQDRYGNIIFRQDKRICNNCKFDFEKFSGENLINFNIFPKIVENRERIISEESAYQMTSFLAGVIKRGTAKNIKDINFDVAGKTGTTNKNQDAWFVGFNSEITVGVYVGYDSPKTLGKFETGSRVAAPIFSYFMKEAYKNRKPKPFVAPEGIKFINIDIKSGKPTNKNYIQEAFKKDFSFEKNELKEILPIEENYDVRGFY